LEALKDLQIRNKLQETANLKNPDKAKPSVRRGRKAAGLIRSKMAELPKDDLW
jgi:hypothetical protein